MTEPLRVVVVGLGPVGAAIARALHHRPDVQIVAAVDLDPMKVGKDLAEIAELPNMTGVPVMPELPPAATAEVAVHATGSRLLQVASQLEALLAKGFHVVSTCEELAYPWRAQPKLAARLDEAARATHRVLHGTGVNPGFVMDKLALTFSAMAHQVSAVKVTRVVDASTRRLPLQMKVGAGLTAEVFRQGAAAGRIGHVGLAESAAMIADGLGLGWEAYHESLTPVLADRRIQTPFLTAEEGQVAGLHQVGTATVGGKTVVTLDLTMAVGAKDPRDEIELIGVPGLKLVIPGGTPGDGATAAAVVNALWRVREANPGLRTALELPVRLAPWHQPSPAAV